MATDSVTTPAFPARLAVLELDAPEWLEFASSLPEAVPFHHPAWAKVMADCYGYPGFAAVLRSDGVIAAGLPVVEVPRVLRRGSRWVALPFTDECAPLVRDRAAEADFTAELARLSDERSIGVEVRAGLDGDAVRSSPVAVTHRLALEADPDAVFGGFHRSQVQRSIGRAERDGVHARRGEHKTDLTEIFFALHLQTRRRQGVPVQPGRFFELLWDRIVERGLGFVSVAEVEGVPVAAAFFLAWNGTVTYKYGASDPAFLKHRPNHALFWEAIRWSCEHGYRSFDFGRTDLDNAGLRSFKSGWGAEELPLVYSTIGGDTPGVGGGRPARALAQVIRRSPPWVCRRLGELLYKYVA